MKALRSVLMIAEIAAIGVGTAYAQPVTLKIAGAFRCVPEVDTCLWSGNTFVVSQTGTGLDVKNDKGEVGHGTITSNISISMGPPWNMLGVMVDNNNQIEWSNGTRWQKQ